MGRRGGVKMSVFIVDTHVVKPEKQEQYTSLVRRVRKYMKENPETFKEVKSLRVFAQTFGGIAGGHVQLWEYKNMADIEKSLTKMFKDKGFMEIKREFDRLIEPATHSWNVWNAVM